MIEHVLSKHEGSGFNPQYLKKNLVLVGEMTDARARIGKAQDESGTSVPESKGREKCGD